MNFRALIFDWDGTLCDSTAFIVDVVRQAFVHCRLTPPAPEESRRIIGLNLYRSFEILRPGLRPEQYHALTESYRDCRRTVLARGLSEPLFPGAGEMLRRLARDYVLGVATGKSRIGLERAMTETRTANLFAATRTADDCASKPAPDMILSLCEAFGIKPGEALMIGDTTHDLLAAHAAGAHAVGVATGAHEAEQLRAVPSLGVFDSLAEIEAWLISSR